MTLVGFILESFRYIFCSKYKAYLFTFQKREENYISSAPDIALLFAQKQNGSIGNKKGPQKRKSPRQIERQDEEGRQDF